jgi:hypothetical protein
MVVLVNVHERASCGGRPEVDRLIRAHAAFREKEKGARLGRRRGVVYSYQRCTKKQIEDVDAAGGSERSFDV